MEALEIKRHLSTDGTFSPEAVNVLGHLPASALFHVRHRLRHPQSLYSLSLDRIAEQFLRVSDAYIKKTAECQTDAKMMDLQDLLQRQDNFLRSLQEHLDDCYSIMKTLVDPSSKPKKYSRFAEDFVMANKVPGAKPFQQSIKGYNHDLRIVNNLKHQQARLRGIAIWTSAGAHLGYFVEEPNGYGIIGPSEDIHPDGGCISFARDLSWHLFNVYRCSAGLAVAIGRALQGLHGFSLKPQAEKPNDKWHQVIAQACKLPETIFPKERPKHIARLRLSDDNQTLT